MGVDYEHWLLPARRDFRPSIEALVALVDALRRERWVLGPEHPHFADLRGGFGTPRIGGVDTGGYATVFSKNPNYPTGNHTFVVNPQKVARASPAERWIPAPLTARWIEDQLDPLCGPLGQELTLSFPLQVPAKRFETWGAAGVQYPFTVGEHDTTNYHQLELLLTDDFATDAGSNGFPEPLDDACECGARLAYDPDELTEFARAVTLLGRIRRRCPACGTLFDPGKKAVTHIDGWTHEARDFLGGVTFRFALRIDCHKGWPRTAEPIRLNRGLAELVERNLGEDFIDVGVLS